MSGPLSSKQESLLRSIQITILPDIGVVSGESHRTNSNTVQIKWAISMVLTITLNNFFLVIFFYFNLIIYL